MRRRKPLRLATLLTTLIIALVLLSSSTIGFFAYSFASDSLREQALASVRNAVVLNERMLKETLQRQQIRASSILRFFNSVCSRDLGWSQKECMASQLQLYVEQGAALRALLHTKGATITYGVDADELEQHPTLKGKRLAILTFDEKPGRYIVEAASDDDYIRIEFRLQDLLATVQNQKEEEARQNWMLAPDGSFLYPAKEPFKGAGELAQGCLDGESGERFVSDNTDKSRVLAYRHLGFLGGGCLSVSSDATQIMAPATRLRNLSFGLALLFAFISLPIGFLVSRRLTGPLENLTHLANKMSSGDLKARANVQGTHELRVLATSLNDMASALAASEDDLRQSELRARLRRDWLESLFDLLPTPLILLNIRTNELQLSNEAALSTRDLFLHTGSSSTESRCFDGAGREIETDALPHNRALRGEVVKNAEVDYRTPIGTLSLLVSACVVPGLDGLDPSLVISYLDISPLRQTQSELQLALRARDEFLTVASHELKTPLTTLQLRIQNLLFLIDKGEGVELSSDRLLVMLQSMEGETTRLVKLVHTLLDLSRAEIGKLALTPQWVDLAMLVRNAADRMRAQYQHAGSELNVTGPDKLRGCWDEARIEQVIVNLLSNALKFGGANPVDVKLDEFDETAVVEVTDRGIGLAPADIDRVFQPYERAEGASRIGGLGLGLYISREIVMAHRGTIQIQSKPAHGTTIRLELPKRWRHDG